MFNPFKPSNSYSVVYWRNPTPAEIRFGNSATHYAEFCLDDCTKPDGSLKKWFKSDIDNLRYYR